MQPARMYVWMVALVACADGTPGVTELDSGSGGSSDGAGTRPDTSSAVDVLGWPDIVADVGPPVTDAGSDSGHTAGDTPGASTGDAPGAPGDTIPGQTDASGDGGGGVGADAGAADDAGTPIEPPPCAAPPFFTNADVSAIAPCVTVSTLYVDLCNGIADTVVLPQLQTVELAMQLCLDAGDAAHLPALKDALGVHLRLEAADVTLDFAVHAIEEASIEVDVLAPMVEVPGLLSAGGALTITAKSQAVRFPDLTAAGGLLLGEGPADELHFPALETAGWLQVNGSLLSWIEAPALLSVAGHVQVFGQDFAELSAPGLKTVGGDLRLASGPFASPISFPSLVSVGGGLELRLDVDCEAQPCEGLKVGPAAVSLPKLATVGGELALVDTRAPESLTLPALQTAGSLKIAGNAFLASVEVPMSVTVGGPVVITNNPALPQCLATWLADAASATEATVHGNLDGCACAPSPPGPPVATCDGP